VCEGCGGVRRERGGEVYNWEGARGAVRSDVFGRYVERRKNTQCISQEVPHTNRIINRLNAIAILFLDNDTLTQRTHRLYM